MIDLAAIARSLPIYRHEAEIVAAVRDHRAVVLEGPTGSGKTTQLPRILLEARLAERVIGITQPRRIAAVSVAHRIAAEEGVVVGQKVGYAIRFDDQTSRSTRLKVMTDGILLQEVRSDPDLTAYDVIVVDEAHERSLNIDFCLGLLYQLLQRRDDLRVVVSSATMQPEVFQDFFSGVAGRVPLISIKARTFPIRVDYRPLRTQGPDALIAAVAQHVVEIHRRAEPGHILAFLTGESMIAQTAEAVRRLREGRDLVVLPLYGRLPREEQERVFEDFGAKRKAVLATNIAETSITIADVRFVVDTGLAKIPRFDSRSGMTSLREEPISQASAEQRAGRAGRTAPGRVIRLYSQAGLFRQPEFTEEEIRRLDLSEVVLRLIDLGVHEVEAFHFPTPPPRKKLAAALRALTAMGAIDDRRHLTAIGHRMVPFPLPPAIARMVVEAVDRFPDVLEEVLIVGAFLSVRPPYLFPLDEEFEARQAHRGLAHPLGDAVTAVQTYRAWSRAPDRERYCQEHYLDPDVMDFIDKTRAQLADIAEEHGLEVGRRGKPEGIVRCVAAGFADKLLRRHRRGAYVTREGFDVSIHPGSSLFGTRHPFLVAAEIVISSRAFARHASVLEPEWIADIDPELARRWRVRVARGKRRGGTPPKVPASVDVGGVSLQVRRRRGRLHVDIDGSQVERLRGVAPADLDPAVAKWPARIVTPQGIFGGGISLGRLVRLLPHLPLPGPTDELIQDVPEGAILTVEHNWPTMERFLGRLLEPARPTTGKKPGWLSLVANGLGEFWFEVLRDFDAALQTTVISFEALLNALGDRHAAYPQLSRQYDRLVERLEAVDRRG